MEMTLISVAVIVLYAHGGSFQTLASKPRNLQHRLPPPESARTACITPNPTGREELPEALSLALPAAIFRERVAVVS